MRIFYDWKIFVRVVLSNIVASRSKTKYIANANMRALVTFFITTANNIFF